MPSARLLKTTTLLIAAATCLPAQNPDGEREIPIVRMAGGREVGRGVLNVGPSRVTGRVDSAETVLQASFELSGTGRVLRFHRTLRSKEPDALLSEVELEREGGGYVLREATPLGSRTRILQRDPVSLVVDGSWPEGVIPALEELHGGYIRTLILAGTRIETVPVRPREGTARYLELPGGGITYRAGDQGRFQSLLAPDGLRILRAGAAKEEVETSPAGVAGDEVVVRSGEVELHGRLALPAGAGDPVPGVVLLADSGPRDEDGNPPGGGSGLLRHLAVELARGGVASIRYAKRGAFQSKGPQEGLTGLVEDARAAALSLRDREAVSGGKLALVGHGEGGLVALQAARDRPDLFGAVVTLGAPARPLAITLETRLRRRMEAEGEPPDHIEARVEALREDLQELRDLPEDEDPGAGRRLLRDLLEVDPVDAYKKLQVPVLILYGEEDRLVPSGQRSMLRTAMAFGTRAPFHIRELQLADHAFLQVSSAERRSSGLDRDTDVARPRHPGLALYLLDFLERYLEDGEGSGR